MLVFDILITFIKWLFIELPLEIISFFVVPVALLFCNKQSTHLPKWASWFDDINYGINGDYGWQTEHYPNGAYKTYFARLRFLYRNRISTFTHKYLGVKVSDIEYFYVVGDKDATYNDKKQNTQCYIRAFLNNGKSVYCLYKAIHYGNGRYCRVYLGHKLMDIANYKDDLQAYLSKPDTKKVLQSVVAINPFKKEKDNKK